MTIGGIQTKRKYDKEFKLEAVRLVIEEGHSAHSIEKRLGTGAGVVTRWVKQYTADPERANTQGAKIHKRRKTCYSIQTVIWP